MTLVAVCGNAGTGKDTAANYLIKEHGYKSMSFADPIKDMLQFIFDFTDEQLYGSSDNRNAWDERFDKPSPNEVYNKAWDKAQIEAAIWIDALAPKLFEQELECQGPEEKLFWEKFNWLRKHHPRLTPRIALQVFGTEWGRALDPSLWTKVLIRRIMEADYPVVVSDTRFKNELKALKQAGAFCIKINRKEAEALASLVGIQGHQSEAELLTIPDSEFDMVIDNNKSLDKFHQTINMIPTLVGHR